VTGGGKRNIEIFFCYQFPVTCHQFLCELISGKYIENFYPLGKGFISHGHTGVFILKTNIEK
jgi:hypothetical protein